MQGHLKLWLETPRDKAPQWGAGVKCSELLDNFIPLSLATDTGCNAHNWASESPEGIHGPAVPVQFLGYFPFSSQDLLWDCIPQLSGKMCFNLTGAIHAKRMILKIITWHD